jgi:hypothetical protein
MESERSQVVIKEEVEEEKNIGLANILMPLQEEDPLER